MHEGIENDDKYRMVEDEFLTVAKTFTVHLHAAEYKRQQKIVKSRNAETINSISRPVTGKMPDHTKRKAEAAARAKAQKAALEGVLARGKKAEDSSDDSDDGDGLPYFGTTLHGLMDSPRKKAASLARLVTIAATTRAAAGFKQSAAHSNPERQANQESPVSKTAFRAANAIQSKDASTESSEDDDDDLDAHIPAPKLTYVDRKPVVNSHSYVSSSASIKTTKPFPEPKQSSLSTTSRSFVVESKPSFISRSPSPEIRPRPSRFDRARREKAKLEKEKQEKKGLDIIPAFL
jgi:hypothetical protein